MTNDKVREAAEKYAEQVAMPDKELVIECFLAGYQARDEEVKNVDEEKIIETIDGRMNEDAENSINRNMYELHEADARVRHFKSGAQWARRELIKELQDIIKVVRRISTSAHSVIGEDTSDYMSISMPALAFRDLKSKLSALDRIMEGK